MGMNRQTIRTYQFSKNEVHEALLQWMRERDLPVPMYVGNAGTTKWTHDDGGVRVEWTEDDKVEIT